MTSKEFINQGQVAVQKIMHESYGINVSVNEIEIVWFNYTLGNMKMLLWAKQFGSFYPEITYNGNRDCIYVDVYAKTIHKDINLLQTK